MKAIFLILIIIIVFLATVGMGLLAPYHFYDTVYREGISNELYESKVLKDYSNTERFKIRTMDGMFNEDDKIWNNFHFNNFQISFPSRHPITLIIPRVRIVKSKIDMGATYIDENKKELFSFITEDKAIFDRKAVEDKIFSLPLFETFINKKSNKQIWNDIFNKDISLPLIENESYEDRIKRLWKIPYIELVYNLYLFKMRQKIFPKKTESITFYKRLNLGVVRYAGADGLEKRFQSQYITEWLYFLVKGKVYRIKIRMRTEDIVAESIRVRFYENLSFIPSNEDSSVGIYAKYKNLDYEARIGQEGMTYLFSCWTHSPDNENFLQEMIQFLERGRQNLFHLAPLYEFAYQKFGTNFSLIKGNIKENEAMRLKRKMKEELEKELEKARSSTEEIVEGKYENEEQRNDFLLRKAKENDTDTSNSDNVILLD